MKDSATSLTACPICAGVSTPPVLEETLIAANDIIARTDTIVALVNTFFIKGSEGHVIIVPRSHYESIYDLPDTIGCEIYRLSRQIASVMRRTYAGCEGITIQQNNEQAGGQDVAHYHLHIVPRYKNDLFGLKKSVAKRVPAPIEQRSRYAAMMREGLAHLTGSS